MAVRVLALTFMLSLASTPALAHVDLDWPTMASTSQKDGPCGSPDPLAEKFYFRPGQTITVRYTETIYHEGHFRIAFAPTPDDLTAPVDCGDVGAPLEQVGNMTILADELYPVAYTSDDVMGCEGRVGEARPGAELTTEITLPNTTCEGCVLQMIQFMTDKPPLGDAGGNDLYFRCAWVTLTDDPEIEPSVDPLVGVDPGADPGEEDPGTEPDGGDSGSAGNPENPISSSNETISGGCMAGSEGQASSLTGSLALLGLAFLYRRRRTRLLS